jgi:hypothetical protein
VKFVWINFHLESVEALAQSDVASNRYRIALPALALRELGHEVRIIGAKPFLARGGTEDPFAEADLVVFSKVSATDDAPDLEKSRGMMAELYATLLRRVPEPERRVVFDFNDAHFESPAFSRFYGGAGQRARAWTACSAAFAQALASHTRLPVLEIPDPYDGPGGTPRAPNLDTERRTLIGRFLKRFDDPRQVGVLWFGHLASLPALGQVMKSLEHLGGQWPLELHCVTSPHPSIVELCEDIARLRLPGFTARFTPWTREATWRALESCDIVLLPAELDERGRVKSANRLVEALRAGRIAVAHPLPAYLELQDFAWVGAALDDGIRAVLADPVAAQQRAREGQRHVEEKFSAHSIAQRWLKAAI